jgi:nucleotide-binding universal stress UspA family protein
MPAFEHILVATDFGDASERALDVAVELAEKFSASLTLVHTYEIPTYVYAEMGGFSPVDLLTPVEDVAKQQFEVALATLRKRLPRAKGILRRGDPRAEILAAIDVTQADLVVMGTHGRRGLAHAFLGSVAEKTVRTSKVPVLTIRAADEAAKA